MLAFYFAGLGLIVGSFLNVLILRTGTEEGLGGRSHCPRCGHALTWFDLIPVFSWIVLRGRCRSCRGSISLQYPFVEASTAALFLIVSLSGISLLEQVIACVIVSLGIAIAVFDIHHHLIPDEWSYSMAAAAFVYGLLADPELALYLHVAAGIIAALPLYALWAYSQGTWMGFGDVKLALTLGWVLGPVYGIIGVMFGFVIGAVVSVGILIPLTQLHTFAQNYGLRGLRSTPAHFTMKSEVPFGPFLIASCFILWFSMLYGIHLPLIM